MTGQLAYGWYGKIPSAGDFVQRGLSAPFVGAWDRWMQDLLLQGRAALGDRWDACYCAAPIWRFALAPATCGPRAAAGVMMPSVDRVGRQFPLCLAAESDAPLWSAYRALERAFAELEELALAMLEDDGDQGHLASALGTLEAPANGEAVVARSAGNATALLIDGAVEAGLASVAAGSASALWVAEIEGRSLVLLSPHQSDGKAEAAALFDVDAPCWTIPQ